MPPRSVPREDRLFYLSLVPFAYIIIAALLLLALSITWKALPALEAYGIDLFLRNVWAPREDSPGDYGLLAAIYGTLVSAFIAVVLALPLSVSLAIAVEELAPKPLRGAIAFLNDVAAGFPTIAFGLWGVEYLVPFLRDYVMRPLYSSIGFLPTFSCEPLSGASLLAAGTLLAFMVTPFMTALIREAYASVPFHLREAAASVSSAWYQEVLLVLGMIKPAIVAALLLGYGRAAGETVAVSLVVGNSFNVSLCLFAPSYTVSALIANQFGNATYYPLMPEVLFAGGVFLFVIGLVINWMGVRMIERVRWVG